MSHQSQTTNVSTQPLKFWVYKINWISRHIAVHSQHTTLDKCLTALQEAIRTSPPEELNICTFGMVEPSDTMLSTQRVFNLKDGKPQKIES